MEFPVIDGYLLDGRPGKSETIASVLRERSEVPAAQPFYRALETLGVRAADEALLALRLVLASKQPDDVSVRRLRGLVALARARSRAQIDAAFAGAAGTLADLAGARDDPDRIAAAARAAYIATF